MRGWNFGSLADRWVESPTPWNYRSRVLFKLRRSDSLLDLGTGGGEFLSSLDQLPKRVCATEGYAPNAPVANETLRSLGVDVIRTYSEDNSTYPQVGSLPFRGECFDLVIDRHESFVATEVSRVLRSRGTFLTQQVGGENLVELNEMLGAEKPVRKWNLNIAVKQLENAGFKITEKQAASLTSWFKDIGAVVCCLKAITWQIPGFSVQGYFEELRKLDGQMRKQGGLKVKATRFFLEATKEPQ